MPGGPVGPTGGHGVRRRGCGARDWEEGAAAPAAGPKVLERGDMMPPGEDGDSTPLLLGKSCTPAMAASLARRPAFFAAP